MSEGWLLRLDWGNVPAWVGSILTGTSLLIAAFSYRRSVMDKERDQASKVAAWIALVNEDGHRKRVLRISNGSDASIYELTCRPHNDREIFLEELPAKATTAVGLRGVGPQPKITKQAIAGIKFWFVSVETTTTTEVFSQEPSPEIEFCDALGRWWRRSPRGEVRRIRSRVRTTYAEANSIVSLADGIWREPASSTRTSAGFERNRSHMPDVLVTDPAAPPPYAIPQVEQADLILLPMYMDGDRAIYADGTTTAVKRLRGLGARAEWSHDAAHRAWYGERAAGQVVVEFVVGVLSSAGWDAIKLLFRQGTGTIRLKLYWRTDSNGTDEKWVELEGDSKAVSEMVDRLNPWNPHSKDDSDEV